MLEFESQEELGSLSAGATTYEATEPAIEHYISRLYVPTLSNLPADQQESLACAMRERLLATVRAHEELGMARPRAVAESLRTANQTVLPVTLDSTRASRARQWQRDARRDTALSVGMFGAPLLLDASRVGLDGSPAYYRLMLFAAPVLAGLLTGFLARGRAERAALRALFLLAIPALLAPGLIWGLGFAFPEMPQPPQWIDMLRMWGFHAFCGIGWWLLLGCSAAFTGKRLQVRARRRRRTGFSD